MDHATPGTKQRLIDTSIDLIWQSSYGAVSVDDICAAANVRKGSFYHYFPSKAHLAVAAMEEHFETTRAEIESVFSAALPPIARFENLADLILEKQEQAFEKYGRVCGCPFASLASEIAGHEDTIQAKANEIFARHQAYCEDALRDALAQELLPPDTDIRARAEEIRTYILGQMMTARIQNSLDCIRRGLKEGLMQIIGARSTAYDTVKA